MQNQILNGVSPLAVNPQLNYIDPVQQLKKSVLNNLQQILVLTQKGIITNEQAHNFMNTINEMYKVNSTPTTVANSQTEPTETEQNLSPLEIFNKENPEFFTQYGRGDVLSYIKNLTMDKDEISKIAKMVENLEKSAIEGYLKKSSHDKTLNDENLAAKSKLTSYAQNAKYDSNNNKVFTREEIGKMSGDEFAKNQKIIMAQVKQGLIK